MAYTFILKKTKTYLLCEKERIRAVHIPGPWMEQLPGLGEKP
jgi:hypothetical protein